MLVRIRQARHLHSFTHHLYLMVQSQLAAVGLLLVILSFAVLNNEDRYEFRLQFDHDAKAIEESIMLQNPASSWTDAFSPDNFLMIDNDPVDLVSITSCTGQDEDEIVTYHLVGTDFVLAGEEDLHDEIYDPFVYTFVRSDLDNELDGLGCVYTFHVYPTEDFASNEPIAAALCVALLFVLLVAGFYVFDAAWKRQQDKLSKLARNSNGVLATLFPRNIREKLVEEYEEGKDKHLTHEERLKKLVNDGNGHCKEAEDGLNDDGEDGAVILNQKSLAELFPEATVLFADIVGVSILVLAT